MNILIIFIIFIAGCGQLQFDNESLFEKTEERSEDIVGGFHSITDGRL